MLNRTLDLLREGIEKQQHPGAQIYVSRYGEVLADEAFGVSRVRGSQPEVPMYRDSLLLWLSTGKPITAIAIAQLMEQGKINLDHQVAKYLPRFGAGGKSDITIRQLLTHTAGFRPFTLDWPRIAWDDLIDQICASPLEAEWIPGERAGYHAASSWFVLGELVQLQDGRPFSQYVREEIFLPLGMYDCWIGMPPQRYTDYHEKISTIYDMDTGAPAERDWTSLVNMTSCSPGGGAIGPANQLGLLFEMLLNGGETHGGEQHGTRILQPETVRLLTTRQRIGMFDETFHAVIDWGLGFVINSRPKGLQMMPYGYGNHASDNTFGHSGFQSSTAFADPAHGLVVVIITNGMPGEARNHRRFRSLDNMLYEELGLTAK